MDFFLTKYLKEWGDVNGRGPGAEQMSHSNFEGSFKFKKCSNDEKQYLVQN